MPDRPSPAKKLLAMAVVLGLGIYGVGFLTGSDAPPRAVAASDPPPVTLDADAVQGHVLPFKIIAAIRNFGFKEGMIPAQISVAVEGGKSADWMATAIYIAEHATGNGAFYSVVEVYVPNPWGDMPPQQYKKLSQVYYAPDPVHSPWGNEDPWTILTAAKAGTLPDIEFDKLSGDLLSDKISDPDKRMDIADAQAKRIVIQKYKLSPKWKPAKGLGLTGIIYHRGHVDVVAGSDIVGSMQALSDCLHSDGGTPLFKGCYPADLRSR